MLDLEEINQSQNTIRLTIQQSNPDWHNKEAANKLVEGIEWIESTC